LLSCLFWCAIAPSVAQSSEIERARALHKAGKSGQALNVLEPLVDRAGTRYEALLLRGDILIEQGTDAEAALAAYSGAIHVAPDSLAPHLNRGALYLALNMPERAIPDLETALSKSTGTSDSTVVLSNLGNAYTMVRKFDRALTYYDLALQLDSVSWTTLNNKAAVLDDLGRTDEAYSIYLKLHEQKPDELPILNNLGFMSSNQERYADALKWFQKARELAPNDAYILNNLGYVQLKMGDTKAALASVNSSIKAFGSNSYAYRNLALVQIARGDPSAACDALERALALGFTKQYGDEVDRLRKAHCR
jgi:Flp pilus assembly protein TadD